MITVFGQAGDLIDKCLNWFIGLSPQIKIILFLKIMFAVVIAIIFYIVYLRSNN